VTKACRYDPDLNPTYQEMAMHYGVGVVPAARSMNGICSSASTISLWPVRPSGVPASAKGLTTSTEVAWFSRSGRDGPQLNVLIDFDFVAIDLFLAVDAECRPWPCGQALGRDNFLAAQADAYVSSAIRFSA
jgi:hypothetical protein